MIMEKDSKALPVEGKTAEEVIRSEDVTAVEAAEMRYDASLPAKRSMLDLMSIISNIISDVNQETAIEHVRQLQENYPQASKDELIEILIKKKCQRTALIGAATSGAAVIPGVGTIAALTLGVMADISMTFKLQAELVMEIAVAHQRLLTEIERQQAVLLVTGLSAGTNQLVGRAGRKVSFEIGERYAEKWLVRFLPIIGVAASAGTNVFSTYIVGRRAHAYFKLGPEQMKDWRESLRAISGVDERKIKSWLSGSKAPNAGQTITNGAEKVAGSVISAGKSVTKSTQSAIKSGARAAEPLTKSLRKRFRRAHRTQAKQDKQG